MEERRGLVEVYRARRACDSKPVTHPYQGRRLRASVMLENLRASMGAVPSKGIAEAVPLYLLTPFVRGYSAKV